MNRFQHALLSFATMGSLVMPGWDAAAAELGDFCWLTESGQLLRFSVSQSAPTHFTYTGAFSDNDGANFAILANLSLSVVR